MTAQTLSPEGVAQRKQKVWDTIKAEALADDLLASAQNSRELASRAHESSVWLNVLPISSLGLHMDDSTMIRIAVGLLLGAHLCRPHSCHHCGTEVDSLASNTWAELPME